MLLIDRGIAGLLSLKREADERFARRPHNFFHAELGGSREHVVRAHHVYPERLAIGENERCRDRRQVNNRIRTSQGVDRLPEVGQVRDQRRRTRISRGGHINVGDVVAVFDEIGHNGSTGLSAPAGNYDFVHPLSLRYAVSLRHHPRTKGPAESVTHW